MNVPHCYHVATVYYFTKLPTYDAENVEHPGLLLLVIQDSSADVGGVVEGSGEALAGPVPSLDGRLAGFLIQGHTDARIRDHAGDGAFLALLHHQR